MLAATYSRGSPSVTKDLVVAYARVHLSKTSHPHLAQRTAEASTALEHRISSELNAAERERATQLAGEFFMRCGRKEYTFCSQTDDLNKPPSQ
jgi:hypothetical protein